MIRATAVGFSIKLLLLQHFFPVTISSDICILSFLSDIMSQNAIGAPARQLDEFEQLVYEYTARMGLGNEEVSTICSNVQPMNCIHQLRSATCRIEFPRLPVSQL